ncbi:MAG: hypothetical protein LUO95_10845 [Methylococcaceae bacterium]|nr:hypothetical protein [Methylococcaceae bacterium]MDD1611057.1 hypothetical protein [Methylococcaceae bacterium]
MSEKVDITIKIAHSLRLQLESSLPVAIGESQFFVDLADIREICHAYLTAVDRITSSEVEDLEKLKDIFYEIDCQLFVHLPYHLKSLKKLLPKVIEALEADNESLR